jgi:hypothetical protein
VLGDRLVDLGYRVLGDVDPGSVDPALAEFLHQEAHRATGVEDRSRVEVTDDAVGDLAKEFQPALVALVRPAAAPVVGVIGGAVLGFGAPLSAWARRDCLL